jgi:hypothetical protein
MGVSSDVQLPEAAAELLDTAAAVVRPWLTSLVQRHVGANTKTSDLGTSDLGESDHTECDQLIETVAAQLLLDLEKLLATDVDAQSTNPLALFRSSTAPITEWLQRRHVSPRHRDPFAVDAFPDDVYGLFPARWDDIDPSLQSPGITWGAWKAMTILQRRRHEGAR